MKNVEEELKLKSRNEYYKNYRFYDEREYRYVPDYEDLKTRGIAPYLSEEQYEKYKLSHNGKSLIDFSVKFTENDLKMIIVHNNDEAKSLKCSQGLTDVHIFTHEEVKQSIVGVGHKVEREISGNNYTLLM